MKKQTNLSTNSSLKLNKTAIANLTLTHRQMANIVGGQQAVGAVGNTIGVSDVVDIDNPCTARPTLLSAKCPAGAATM